MARDDSSSRSSSSSRNNTDASPASKPRDPPQTYQPPPLPSHALPPTSSSTSTSLASTSRSVESPPTSSSSTGPAASFPTAAVAAAAAAASSVLQQNGDRPPTLSSSSSPPSMSHPQHSPGPPRQPTGYPVQGSYPTTMATATHYGYAPSHANDHYRGGPGPDVVAATLPSMRTIEPAGQQQSHISHAPPPLYPVMGHHTVPSYYPQQPMLGHPYLPQGDMFGRIPMAPHDPRFGIMRGPKKEIKRRTKTGCMTCRKRRIKCDETHPTCNNCKKSKRECLGYDPIFKQQQGQTGSSGQQSQRHQQGGPGQPSLPSSSPSISTSSAPKPYGKPAAAVLPSSYLSTSSAPDNPNLKSESYDYGSIDPSLHGNNSSTGDSASSRNTPQSADKLVDNAHLRAKKMKVYEIFGLFGPCPAVHPLEHTEELLAEIMRVYNDVYVHGLIHFLETTWFTFPDTKNNPLLRNNPLIDLFGAFLKAASTSPEKSDMAGTAALEVQLVWSLLCLTYYVPPQDNAALLRLPPAHCGVETRNRVIVIDALLCGDWLDKNPLTPALKDPGSLRVSEFQFWWNLGEYLRLQNRPGKNFSLERAIVLGNMRNLLGGRENRDVLYSIAVVREFGFWHKEPRITLPLPAHLDESDWRNKLAVATRFLKQEVLPTHGTTNVIRRACEVALMAFVKPGVNISRTARE